MKRSERRRADRAQAGRHQVIGELERLEQRELLSLPPGSIKFYQPTFPQARTVDSSSPPLFVAHPIGGSGPRQLSFLDNDGKVLTGKDREGDEWQITVHGPGAVIVTDATPNDGVLDDDLNTIQLINTNPHKTYVTGQVTASARVITDGTVLFNHLISEKGVASIILNGFNLARTVPPIAGQPNNTGPEIYLPGGVNTLAFNDIEAAIDQTGNGSGSDQPFEIQVGDPNSEMRQHPSIRIGKIFNTVFDSSAASQAGSGPQVNPTVNILVNGQLHLLEYVSATARPISGGQEFNFPLVDVTGRTALRALGLDNLKVIGSARNFTASRAGTPFQAQNGQHAPPPTPTQVGVPFQGGFSGLDHLKTATFGGNADAVGLDVTNGLVGRLRFLRGLGSPVGSLPGAINYGFNAAQAGYPSRGLLGGLVTAKAIHQITIGPANLVLQTAQDPDFMQLDRQGSTKYYARPGNAMTHAAIVASKSIGNVDLVGNLQQSEISSGFHYPSYVAGLQPTRAPGHVSPFRLRGDLVNSDVSASFRPGTGGVFGGPGSVYGPGKIRGVENGTLYNTGQATALGRFGAGVFARHRSPNLQPPQTKPRIHSVLIV